jgi:hypothetical protein
MNAAAVLAATAGALLLFSGNPSAAERADCVCLLDGATSAVVGAVRIFEARRPGTTGALAAAQRAFVAASDARDALEAADPSEACAPSWAEELIYLNHLIPGFHAWLDARSRRPPTEYDIASIIRRARVHRERGRARLR